MLHSGCISEYGTGGNACLNLVNYQSDLFKFLTSVALSEIVMLHSGMVKAKGVVL